MYGHAAILLSPDTFVLDAIFERYSAIIGGETIIWSGDDEDIGNRSAQAFLLMTCSIFGTVVMLNMLIALLCDTFERVQQNVVAIRNRELAGLLLDMECLRRPPHMGAYFFMCSQMMYEEKQWTGFLGELKVHTADSMQRLKDQLCENSRQSDARNRRNFEELEQQIKAVSSQLAGLCEISRQSNARIKENFEGLDEQSAETIYL